MQASSDEARAAHTSYLQSVHQFLECANTALSSSRLPANDLETVRAYTREVLTKLTHTLLELFAKDRVWTTIESTCLRDVMRKLSSDSDTRVGECIPDELVPGISDLAEKLATDKDYDEDYLVAYIQSCAHGLKANIARVKCKPGMT